MGWNNIPLRCGMQITMSESSTCRSVPLVDIEPLTIGTEFYRIAEPFAHVMRLRRDFTPFPVWCRKCLFACVLYNLVLCSWAKRSTKVERASADKRILVPRFLYRQMFCNIAYFRFRPAFFYHGALLNISHLQRCHCKTLNSRGPDSRGTAPNLA